MLIQAEEFNRSAEQLASEQRRQMAASRGAKAQNFVSRNVRNKAAGHKLRGYM